MTEYGKLSDEELSNALREYSWGREGDIADLTYAAAIRIAVLAARIKLLKEKIKEGEDDGK